MLFEARSEKVTSKHLQSAGEFGTLQFKNGYTCSSKQSQIYDIAVPILYTHRSQISHHKLWFFNVFITCILVLFKLYSKTSSLIGLRSAYSLKFRINLILGCIIVQQKHIFPDRKIDMPGDFYERAVSQITFELSEKLCLIFTKTII